MTLLNDYKQIVDKLKGFNDCLNPIPRHITSLGYERYLRKSVFSGCSLPFSVFVHPELIHIGIIPAVDVLCAVRVNIIHTFKQSFSVVIIMGYDNISILVTEQAALNITLSVMVEKQACVTRAKLSINSLGAPSVHIPIFPIFFYQVEVLLVCVGWICSVHRVNCLVAAQAQYLLFFDADLVRQSHSFELQFMKVATSEFDAYRRKVCIEHNLVTFGVKLFKKSLLRDYTFFCTRSRYPERICCGRYFTIVYIVHFV